MAKKASRLVFDTNVLISALLIGDSTPGKAFRVALSRGKILISEAVFKELSSVLSREKFDRYLLWDERQRFLASLLLNSTLVDIREQVTVCRDPGDTISSSWL
jgi:putative PIN family toxin of toxin-antitoxin system